MDDLEDEQYGKANLDEGAENKMGGTKAEVIEQEGCLEEEWLKSDDKDDKQNGEFQIESNDLLVRVGYKTEVVETDEKINGKINPEDDKHSVVVQDGVGQDGDGQDKADGANFDFDNESDHDNADHDEILQADDDECKEVKGDEEVKGKKEDENPSSNQIHETGTMKDENNCVGFEENKSSNGHDGHIDNGSDVCRDGDQINNRNDTRDKGNNGNTTHDGDDDDDDETGSSKSFVECDVESDDEGKFKEKQRNNTVNWVLKDVVMRPKAGNLRSGTCSNLCINIKTMAGDGGHATMMSKSVDFSLPGSMCMDDVDEEINQVINSTVDDQMQFGFIDQVSDARALTVNTPATDSHFQIHSIRTPVREKYYEHALMLMNRRCKSGSTYLTSAGMKKEALQSIRTGSGRRVPVYNLPSLVECINQPPFSSNPNSYFYVTQQTHEQSSPLKAWKGYHGNVYFEPMTCKQLDAAPFVRCSRERTKSADETSKSTRTKLPDLEGRTQSRVSFVSDTKTERSKMARSTGSRSSRTKKPLISQRSSISRKMRQMSILDKRSVMKRNNPRLREDMSWISGQESTGSLCIGRPQQRTTLPAYSDSNKHYRLKICRGIASRGHDSTDDQSPAFSLHGGGLNESSSANAQTNYQSRPGLATPEDASEFYRYSSTRTSILDGSQSNIDQSNGLVHVVPSPNQGNSRQLYVKDTSFQMTFSH